MNALILNLATLAVTEYDVPCTGVAGNFEASPTGVHKVADTCDPAAARFSFGATLGSGERQQRPKYVYVFGDGLSSLEATVADTRGNTYDYPVQSVHDRAARFVLGAGIRDNYIGLSVSRASTEPLMLDRLELVMLTSNTRRL